MVHRSRKISQAWLMTPTKGIIELAKNWPNSEKPDMTLTGGVPFASVQRLPDHVYAKGHGYCITTTGLLCFMAFLSQYPDFDPLDDRLFVSGDFNGWQVANDSKWEMYPASFGGESVMVCILPASEVPGGSHRFKFVTAGKEWLQVSNEAPNAERDDQGNLNHRLDPEQFLTERTGVERDGLSNRIIVKRSGAFPEEWPAVEAKLTVRKTKIAKGKAGGNLISASARVRQYAGGETIKKWIGRLP